MEIAGSNLSFFLRESFHASLHASSASLSPCTHCTCQRRSFLSLLVSFSGVSPRAVLVFFLSLSRHEGRGGVAKQTSFSLEWTRERERERKNQRKRDVFLLTDSLPHQIANGLSCRPPSPAASSVHTPVLYPSNFHGCLSSAVRTYTLSVYTYIEWRRAQTFCFSSFASSSFSSLRAKAWN